ncbi:MAG: ATP--guanido phosphotransferase [Sulfobacillus sp.]
MSMDDHAARALSPWLEQDGPAQDVILSSRARLARNVTGMHFPDRMSQAEQTALVERVGGAVGKLGADWDYFPISAVAPVDLQVLMEKHLVSPQFLQGELQRAVAIRQDEGTALMVNEEDHVRIQAFAPGLNVEAALNTALEVDDGLERELDWEVDSRRGYLTACPTNLGTGLRVSVMAHLPGLVLSESIGHLLQALAQAGVAVRGIYGEGTQALGELFQISNQVTLGEDEQALAEGVAQVAQQVVEQERQARKQLAAEQMGRIQDRVWRAKGILENARLISADEAIAQISALRLGVEMGLLKSPSYATLSALQVVALPGFLDRTAAQDLSREGRFQLRASLIRERLMREDG